MNFGREKELFMFGRGAGEQGVMGAKKQCLRLGRWVLQNFWGANFLNSFLVQGFKTAAPDSIESSTAEQ